jgi:hypothetical protein
MQTPRSVCCVAVRSADPLVSPPRPVALEGVRVIRRARTERVERRALLLGFSVQLEELDPSRVEATAVLRGERVEVSAGFDALAALEPVVRHGISRPLDTSGWEDALRRGQRAVEAYAKQVLHERIQSRAKRAWANVAHATRYVQSMLDESPVDRRHEVGERGRAVIEAVRAFEQPVLTVTPVLALDLTVVEARASWRLSEDGVACSLSSGARGDGSTWIDPCGSCGGSSVGWTICAQCVVARCGRCGRRCARCGHRGCVQCAQGARCARCGLPRGETP